MVATVKRDFRDVMVFDAINYREMHADGVVQKIAILYLSLVEETEDKNGKGPRGWLAKEPAEIVSLANGAIYECPALQDLGIIDEATLRTEYRNVLTAKRDAAQKDTKKEYKTELVAVYNEMIEAIDGIEEMVVGGLHRGSAFPDVVAKWRFDQKRADKSMHYKYVETIPCEVLSPVGYADLFAVATERNGRAMSQLGYTFIDLVVLALFVLKNLLKHQTFFRTFVMTGNPRATMAEVKALKESGAIKDGGSKFSLPWAVAECAADDPKLDIVKRLKISENESDAALKAMRIDVSRLQYLPLESGDIHKNVNYYRACASADLADEYFSASQTKNKETHGLPGTEPAECYRTGVYWTAEQRAAWWNGNCPAHPDNAAKGMPSQVDTKKVSIDLKRVQGVAKNAETDLVKAITANLLDVGGKDATIDSFQSTNRQQLKVADGFFTLTKSDAATTASMMKIVAGLQAVKDRDINTFHKMCEDVLSVINEAVGTLKADTAPPKSGSNSPPKGASKSPPKGASKSPPKAESKSPKKASSKR